MDAPRVTIGMTLYNVERYLPEALECLLAQDFRDVEIVACDNRSTDRTWEIVTGFAARDARVRAFRNDTNLGQAGNFRRVVELSRGELMHFAAHDDLAAPQLVGRLVEALDRAGPDTVLAFAGTRIIGPDGEDLCGWPAEGGLDSPLPWRRVFRWAARWQLCNELFGVIRMDALRRTRLLLDTVVSPDVALLAELAMHGRFVQVPETLFARRMHPGGTHQGERSVEEIARYLEPAAGQRQVTRRYALLRETTSALLGGDAPAVTRAGCAAAFAGRYAVRQVGGRVRRARRAPAQPAPWERAPAARTLMNDQG